MDDAHYGPYTPDILLAQSPHAEVWQARGPRGDVALKVAVTEAGRARNLRELDALKAAAVPGVVEVIQADPQGAWIATTLLDGLPFDRWAVSRPVEEIAAAAAKLLVTLARVHARGLVHGDVKPSNILVTPTAEVWLIDFSASRKIGERPTHFEGTPGFVAPERVENRALTPASDVYGAGATLYQAFTGHMPFPSREPTALAYLPLVTLPAPPAVHRPELPGRLGRTLLGMLTRTPERRPTDLVRLAKELRESATAAPDSPIVAMEPERELLRRALIGALSGEARAVVVYGPAGSGRRTLITEAVHTAVREGLPYPKGLSMEAYEAAVASSALPPVLVLNTTQKGAVSLAKTLVTGSKPVIVLLLSNHPVPELRHPSVQQITPSALTPEGARTLAGSAFPSEQVTALWEETAGIPSAFLAALRRERRKRGEALPVKLSPEGALIMAQLRGKGEVALADLALALRSEPLAVVDWIEPLLHEGLVACTPRGDAVRALEIAT